MTVWLHKQEGGYQQSERVDFGASAPTMRQLAQMLLDGRKFTRENFVPSVLTQEQHAKIKAEMLARGLMREVIAGNPRAGVELTAEGRQVMTQIISPTPTSRVP